MTEAGFEPPTFQLLETEQPSSYWPPLRHFLTCLVIFSVPQVSFQHESYPVPVAGQDGEGSCPAGAGACPGGEQPLSRQVFIVQELEVRDRLASSQINKFLYLYTSESMPRRAHSNMVRQHNVWMRERTGFGFTFWFLCLLFSQLTVKALQVCPESGLGGPECCLRISLLPLRLNIDQVTTTSPKVLLSEFQ